MAFTEYIIGKKERLTWADESSYGSGADMANDGIQVGVNATIQPGFDQSFLDILSAGADARTVEGKQAGPLVLPFTLSFTPVDWKFLKYCGYSFGNTGGPTYTHTGSLQGTVQSFELEWAMRHTTAVVVTLTGCVVQRASIRFSKAAGEGTEGFITVELQCVAQDYSTGSSVTSISATTRTPFQYRHSKVTLDNTEISEVNNGEITIEQGIDPQDSRYCNSTLARTIGEPVPKIHRITGRFNLNMKDVSHITDWASAAAVSNCGLDFIENSSDNKLVTTFTGFRYHQAFHSTDLEGLASPDIVWSALSFASIVATDTLSDW